VIKQRQQVGAPETGDVHPRVLQSVQQRVVDRIEEVDPFDGLVADLARFGQPVEGTNTGGEVVKRLGNLPITPCCALPKILIAQYQEPGCMS
jgi:hypothetical protein